MKLNNCWQVLLIGAQFLSAPVSGVDAAGLSEAVPSRALVFVERRGNDAIGTALNETSFGRLLAESEVQEFLHGGWKLVDAMIRSGMREAADLEAYEHGIELLSVLARRPVALAIFGLAHRDDEYVPLTAFIVDVGDEREDFMKTFLAFLRSCGSKRPVQAKNMPDGVRHIPSPVPNGLYFTFHKGHFVLTIGKSTMRQVLGCIEGESRPLAKTKVFGEARKRINGKNETRAWTVFLNVEAALRQVDKLLEVESQSEEGLATMMRKGLEAATVFGLGNIATITWERHYAYGGCWGATFYSLPAGVSVETTYPNAVSLTDDDLSVIPKSVKWVSATNVRLTAALDKMLTAVKSADEETYDSIREALNRASERLGFDLEKEFLPLIGDTIILYETESPGMLPFMGVTILVKSSNATELQEKLNRAVELLSVEIEVDWARHSTVEHKGRRVDVLGLDVRPIPVAIAWGVQDRWLVLGLSPGVVTSTMDRLEAPDHLEQSILANEEVSRLRKRIGPLGTSFSYTNVRSSVQGLYPLVAMGLVGIDGKLDDEEMELEVPVLPSPGVIDKHLSSDVSTTRLVEGGRLSVSYGSLPLKLDVGVLNNIGTVAVATSILLPSLSRARELSKRTVCASNLRGMAQAMYIHAQDDGKFPGNFRALIEVDYITEKQFVCPSSTCEVGDLDCCYVYITGQTTIDNPLNVLVYEKEGVHGPESGANVLFLDGHVEFVKPYTRVEELVEETKARLTQKKKGK